MSHMTNENYQTVLRILGRSGQIERYRSPIIPAHIKDSIAVIMIAVFLAFVGGFYLGVRI